MWQSMEKKPIWATLFGMRALSDNGFVGWFRYRRWRRGMVVGVVAAWSVTLIGWISPPGTVPEWLWVGAVVPTTVAAILLVLATRNLTSSVDAYADERDRIVRDRALRLGYWTLGLPLGALFGLAHSMMRRGTANGVVTLTAAEASGLAAAAVTVVLCYALLPTAILAWSEPDPPADEEGR